MNNCQIVFADLAGSEYGSDSINNNIKQSDKEFKEAKEINSSLLALKECIRKLNKCESHISWRNSLFTRLIKSYLIKTNNQKCKINMLSTIGPLIKGNDKTKNTLRYSVMKNNI